MTPSHQYPTGGVMSLQRHHQLLTLARQHRAWVLEDDYDSEFRLNGPPISSLAGLDTQGQVIYLGSFSKVLHPGLKLGYMVVPKSLAAAFSLLHQPPRPERPGDWLRVRAAGGNHTLWTGHGRGADEGFGALIRWAAWFRNIIPI